MKIKPLQDRLLVKPNEAEERTASGIYLPDGAREKPMHGKVIAAGPGKLDDEGKTMALEVKVGQTVVYSKYAGSELELDGVKHVILRESELLAVVE